MLKLDILSLNLSQSPAYCIAFVATVLVTPVATLTPVLAATPAIPLIPDTAAPAPALSTLTASVAAFIASCLPISSGLLYSPVKSNIANTNSFVNVAAAPIAEATTAPSTAEEPPVTGAATAPTTAAVAATATPATVLMLGTSIPNISPGYSF